MLRTSSLGKALTFIVLLASSGLAQPAKATLVLDLGPGTGGFTGPCSICGNSAGRTFGWDFRVFNTIEVNGLAAWDTNVGTFNRDVQVGLWTGTGTILASTTISDSSPTESSNGDGVWRVEDIAPLILTPGDYTLGQVFFDNGPIIQFDGPFTTIPEVFLIAGFLSPAGIDSGLSFPSAIFSSVVFGPSLRLAPTQLPEPATIALLGFGLGLVGVGVFVKRNRGI